MGKPVIFIGVDPGAKGGFSIVDENSLLIDLWPMSEDILRMSRILMKYAKDPHVLVIEKAQGMASFGKDKKRGASSMFTYGRGYGKLLGMFEVLELQYHEVYPRTWMCKMFKKFNTGKTKEQSAELCKAMHPDQSFILPRCRKIHDGLTDATCIAHYARRFLQ